MNPPQVYMCSPSWTLLPPPSPFHPSGSSQCTSPKHPVSCIEPGLATRFIHDILHVSMPFSQIFPPSPSLTESIRLFYTSVSLLLSRTQGYCYHLSKFHICVLVYCIGVSLWLTSVCIIHILKAGTKLQRIVGPTAALLGLPSSSSRHISERQVSYGASTFYVSLSLFILLPKSAIFFSLCQGLFFFSPPSPCFSASTCPRSTESLRKSFIHESAIHRPSRAQPSSQASFRPKQMWPRRWVM